MPEVITTPVVDHDAQAFAEQIAEFDAAYSVTQYLDGETVVDIHRSAEHSEVQGFSLQEHMSRDDDSPVERVIINTKDGEQYMLWDGKMYDVARSGQKGKVCGIDLADMPADQPLRDIVLGQTWRIPGYANTAEVESVLLEYRRPADHDIARQTWAMGPFAEAGLTLMMADAGDTSHKPKPYPIWTLESLRQPEQRNLQGVFRQGTDLKDSYRNAYRRGLADPDDHTAAIDVAVKEAYRDSWWQQIAEGLEHHNYNLPKVTPQSSGNLVVTAKHTLEVLADNHPTNQRYEVFELGEPQNEAINEVVLKTLELMDELSGGSLSAQPDKPTRVVLGNDLMQKRREDKSVLGFASGSSAFVDIVRCRQIARARGVDVREVIASTLVHEVLGHKLEQDMTGGTGRYFPQYFDYSSRRVPASDVGAAHNDVHRSIKPKDKDWAGSQPVRKYGRINPAEDFAATADAVVGHVMNWPGAKRIDGMTGVPDEYRRNLFMGFLDEAADSVKTKTGTPGAVASKVQQLGNAQNQLIGFEPARKLVRSTIGGQMAVLAEMQAVLNKHQLTVT